MIHYILISQNKQLTKINTYLRKQIRDAKRKYYEHILSLYKNDIKKTRTILNKTLNGIRRKHQSQVFFINNQLVSEPDIIVNEFNAYF